MIPLFTNHSLRDSPCSMAVFDTVCSNMHTRTHRDTYMQTDVPILNTYMNALLDVIGHPSQRTNM